MLLGIGKVPGLIAVVIYAIPPMIRLTNLGIRLVDTEVLEAADAFGASPWQSLSSSNPACTAEYLCRCKPDNHDVACNGRHCLDDRGTGLGQPILKAISNQYLAMGLFNGLAIVAFAIIFDRISQSYGKRLQSYRGGQGE